MIATSGLLGLFLQLVVLGLIFYVLFWGLSKVNLPEPFNKILFVILVIIVVVVLVNILFGLSGNAPLIVWRR